MTQNDVQNRCWIFKKISAPFWLILGARMGATMDPKIAQKSTSAPQGRPEASGEPFGSHFGAIWNPFWTHFGPIWDPFWTHVPPNLRKHCSKSLDKRAFENSRKQHSKSLVKSSFESTAGQRRRRPWLSGRFGARMRPLDPATEHHLNCLQL